MGLFDKVRNMFTEEVDEPEEKVEPKVEKKLEKEEKIEPKIETTEEVVEEETIKQPEKPRPIFFDDQDFATLERPKYKEEKTIVEEKYYTKKVETTEKKVFKLSPVISPVYGVLDKNYHKEDITPKRSTPKVTYYDKESITIDEVRKKAYGTLEDDLETSLASENTDKEVIGSRMQRKYHDEVMLDDLMDPEYNPVKEDKVQKKEKVEEESTKTLEPIALDDFLLPPENDSKEEEKDKEDYKDPLDDTLTESDLFHLIDSMYDKEDE